MIKGSIVALITPFTIDNKINYQSLKKLIEYQIAAGTDGILLLGTTGESESLSIDEQLSIVKFAIEVINRRCKIMVALTSNVTNNVINKARLFEEFEDIDSFLVITPYYNKTNEKGMIKHFTLIADSCRKPIVLYNVPKRTGISISYKALEVLSKHPNIIGIKEASGDLCFQAKISRLLSDNFIMYAGDDVLILPTLSVGGSGSISVAANLMPKLFKNLNMSLDSEEKLKLFNKYFTLIESCFIEISPIPIKYLLNLNGFDVGKCRLPYEELCDISKLELIEINDKFEADLCDSI